jgi:hypothetical protein
MGQPELREIAHDQWVPFLAEFSQAHFGEPVEVRVVGNPEAATTTDAAAAVPLMSIVDRSDAAAGEQIAVVTGAGRRPVSHVVSHPIHVRVLTASGPRPLTVEIEGCDGATTTVRFLADEPGRASDA